MKATIASLFNRLSAWLHRAMSEASGQPSSMRLAMIVWHVSAALVWTGLSVYKHEMVHIDESIIVMLGLPTAGKLAQKFGEAKAPDAPSSE